MHIQIAIMAHVFPYSHAGQGHIAKYTDCFIRVLSTLYHQYIVIVYQYL